MKAIVKSMWINSSGINFDNYFPDDPENFSLWVEFKIGLDGSIGADDYRVFVCTPQWLCENLWEPQWGRHILIIREYDLSVIERCVRDYVEECRGDKWLEIAEKIARNLSWEFEDYQK